MSKNKLPDGITFDGHAYWCQCPECGEEQPDMGNNIACEKCGGGPMPTMDTGADDENETDMFEPQREG